MPNLFVEDQWQIRSKQNEYYPGDIVQIDRSPDGTVAILADGLGSGISAHMDATFLVEYMMGLISGVSDIPEAVCSALKALGKARKSGGPWAAFTLVGFKENRVELYSYEAPPALLFTSHGIKELKYQPEYQHGEILHQANLYMRPQETLLLVSDGVTQSGLGRGLRRGWGTEGIKKYLIEKDLTTGRDASKIPRFLVDQAILLNENRPVDDTSALTLHLRKPQVLHILTGPPADKKDTERVMESFQKASGRKVVCGGTTSKLFAEYLGTPMNIHRGKYGTPAYYEIEGVALACEGTITLNRLNSILFEPELAKRAGYAPSTLRSLVLSTDEIHFWIGQAVNKSQTATLKSAGMLLRSEAVDALTKKLESEGKLVYRRKF